MPADILLVLIVGASIGGIATGVAGFGSGPIIMGFWLLVIPPQTAAPLVIVTSGIYALVALPKVWHAVRLRRIVTLALGAAAGIPIGMVLLVTTPPETIRFAFGIALVVLAIARLTLARRLKFEPATSLPDVGVGFIGGIVSGTTGTPGPIYTLWCNFRGWTRDTQRGVYQPLNLVVVYLTLAAMAWRGLVTGQVLHLALWCTPAAIVGVFAGLWLYRFIDERTFNTMVLTMLVTMGLILIWTSGVIQRAIQGAFAA